MLIVIASSTFFGALIGIIALFTVKGFEANRGRPYFPRVRAALDRFALIVKKFLIRLQVLLAMIPPVAAMLLRLLFAAGARAFARTAHDAAVAAHGLADFVSHKRNFERRPARSEFLRKIEEHKNGTASHAAEDVEIRR